ncbi:MAG: hypothetical protein ACLR9T_04845 [Thomasclavelia sp.]|uniref:hypothetical protein n=1 Tax=Thomasclavelia sp. TaxID=3025757 RepID=UPI0039A0567B
MIEKELTDKKFEFINDKDKQFIIMITKELENIGYTYSDVIGDGYCWGKYMLIFRKANVKSKNVFARIYIREDSIVLRLFFNDVTKHASYIGKAPRIIKEVFINDYGTCKHCKGDNCKFRKDYEIDGIKYEKCNGTTFEFYDPQIENIPDYISLFKEFYPNKKQ